MIEAAITVVALFWVAGIASIAWRAQSRDPLPVSRLRAFLDDEFELDRLRLLKAAVLLIAVECGIAAISLVGRTGSSVASWIALIASVLVLCYLNVGIFFVIKHFSRLFLGTPVRGYAAARAVLYALLWPLWVRPTHVISPAEI